MIGRWSLQLSVLLVVVTSWRVQTGPYHQRRAPHPRLQASDQAAKKAAEMLSRMSVSAISNMKPGEVPVMKEFVSSAQIKHTHRIRAVKGGTVPDYMQLPIDQYALYDSRIMSRLPKSEHGDEDLFEFRLPVVRPPSGQFVPQPRVCMRVLPTDKSISIESVSASLFGDLEQVVDGLPKNVTINDLKTSEEMTKKLFNFAFNTTLAWRPSRKRKSVEGDTDIVATTRVCLTIGLPPPFTRIPRPLVQGAIGIIMRFVGGQILPRFVALLETDYQRWANGTRGELSAGFGRLPIDDDGFMIVNEQKLQKDIESMKAKGGMAGLVAGMHQDLSEATDDLQSEENFLSKNADKTTDEEMIRLGEEATALAAVAESDVGSMVDGVIDVNDMGNVGGDVDTGDMVGDVSADIDTM